MNIIDKLIEYKTNNDLTVDDLYFELRQYGIVISSGSLNNWLGKRCEPSKIAKSIINKFLNNKKGENDGQTT